MTLVKKLFSYIRIFIIITVPLLSFVISTKAYASFESAAKQAILIDHVTGDVLYQKNADVPVHPSSMSKLMTVYMMLSKLKEGSLSLEDKFLVSEKAWRKQGSKMFVEYNSRVTVEELLRGIIVQSGNDSCIVVAEGISGSESAFAEAMNYKAQEIGLKNSHFTNSTGWPDKKHQMSVRDIAVLSQRLFQDFPEYYHYFGETAYRYNGIRQFNRNTLLNQEIGVDGLKTGHTEAGGYGIAISAERGGRRLFVVVNGLLGKNQRIAEAEKLLEYGFRNFEVVQLLKKGQVLDKAEVWFGESLQVPLVVDNDLIVTLPKFWKHGKLNAKVHYKSPVPAPIHEGDVIANLSLNIDSSDRVIKVPLVAGESVQSLSRLKHILRAASIYIIGV